MEGAAAGARASSRDAVEAAARAPTSERPASDSAAGALVSTTFFSSFSSATSVTSELSSGASSERSAKTPSADGTAHDAAWSVESASAGGGAGTGAGGAAGIDGGATVFLSPGAVLSAGSSPPLCSRRRRSTNVSFEMSLNVSATPPPSEATASTNGYGWKFRESWRASTESALGRSRLLYWMTRGSDSRLIFSSWRLSRRFWKDSRLCDSMDHCESTTKTRPSTPRRTILRVSL